MPAATQIAGQPPNPAAARAACGAAQGAQHSRVDPAAARAGRGGRLAPNPHSRPAAGRRGRRRRNLR